MNGLSDDDDGRAHQQSQMYIQDRGVVLWCGISTMIHKTALKIRLYEHTPKFPKTTPTPSSWSGYSI